MRTTLDIDDDILSAAKELARYENKTAGKVLSELARKALTGGVAHTGAGFEMRNGLPVLPATGRIITPEMIDEIQRQLDEEDAIRASSP
ncbi:MAG: hypothetical protein FJX29_05120 [Alphaproteobacteria bacterium]|nr:hypothetical protein [Alphaproteobacteria bacterium]